MQIPDVTHIQVGQSQPVLQCSEVTQANQNAKCKFLQDPLDVKLPIIHATLSMCIYVLHKSAQNQRMPE